MKPNAQMKIVVKMMKKDQGERGMEENLLVPRADRKPHMVTQSQTVPDSVQRDNGWKRVIHAAHNLYRPHSKC